MLFTLCTALLSAAPTPEVVVARNHAAGQKYALEYTNVDVQLGISKTFKATAKVTEATKGHAKLDVTVDSLKWTDSKNVTTSAGGVKLKVSVDGKGVDAEVVDPGTAAESAELELTSFEQLLGDLCQPPDGPYTGKALVKDGSTAWSLTGTKAGVVSLESTPEAGKDPFTCKVSISTADGFAGERVAAMRLTVEGKDGKKLLVEQKQTLKITKK